MTGLVRLFRTTAFKLAAAYLVVFALFAAAVLGYVLWNARRILDAQMTETIETEVNSLAEQYRQGGVRRLIFVVERRARQPGSFIYMIQASTGQMLAGNVAEISPIRMTRAGTSEAHYQRLDESGAPPRPALFRVYELPGGSRLLVGRDLEERALLRGIIGRAMRFSLLLIVVLGVVTALFVSRRMLKRIDAMTDTSRRIMAGDLSGRLPLKGSNDELDRLAQSLNAMLARIAELMQGMKEVSDNIAHDLKTPLTRLRNSAEQAMRTAQSPDDYRMAMERIIDEADGLMRTFNALLMIARAEAGNALDGFRPFDLAHVVNDLAELYEPVAEDQAVALNVSAAPGLNVVGSRELLSQAIANLIENALKYGMRGEGTNSATPVNAITLSAERNGSDLIVTVADRGVGIPAADRSRALERFTRLDTANGKPGSGLGLSLAAAIARLHGGSVLLEDNNPGLKAVMSLPLAKALPA